MDDGRIIRDAKKDIAARIKSLEARVAAADNLADEVARVCQVLAETNGHAPVMLKMLRAAYEATKEGDA